MPYASKYYDPQKAHEYYMRTRELKGYEDRYGGSRGDGTSYASSGKIYQGKTAKAKEEAAKKAADLWNRGKTVYTGFGD